jgi:hypothetical protein
VLSAIGKLSHSVKLGAARVGTCGHGFCMRFGSRVLRVAGLKKRVGARSFVARTSSMFFLGGNGFALDAHDFFFGLLPVV